MFSGRLNSAFVFSAFRNGLPPTHLCSIAAERHSIPLRRPATGGQQLVCPRPHGRWAISGTLAETRTTTMGTSSPERHAPAVEDYFSEFVNHLELMPG